jgi:hypothetical protein
MGAHIAKFSEVDFRRHELRDGSAKMWPERAIDRDPAINLAEVEAALTRRPHSASRGSTFRAAPVPKRKKADDELGHRMAMSVLGEPRPRKFEQKLGGNRSRKYG